MSSDTRRYRSKATGIVYRIVMQARSPFGPVILRAIEGPGEIYTTNDLLAVDYEFFRMGEDAPDRVAARERSREEISADLTAMTASRDEWRTIAQESIAHHEETARERDELREIIDGSEVAPTDAEIIRHAELNGRWRAQTIGGLVADCMGARMTAALRDIDRESGITRKWWATTEDGTPCARPKVPDAPR
jgi:hypothetical protein